MRHVTVATWTAQACRAVVQSGAIMEVCTHRGRLEAEEREARAAPGLGKVRAGWEGEGNPR